MAQLINDKGVILMESDNITYHDGQHGWYAGDMFISDPGRMYSVIGPRTIVSPIEFKLLFTVDERIAIKTSHDPRINDFFSIIEDPRLTHVNLSLQSTRDALDYLQMVGILPEFRKTQILTGQLW